MILNRIANFGSALLTSASRNAIMVEQTRTRVRYLLRYPKEGKRVCKHGFLTKLKYVDGKKEIMKRILDKKMTLTH